MSTAMAFDDAEGALLIAESGMNGSEPHIFGYHLKDGSYFDVYPFKRHCQSLPAPDW